ncbi:M43 family zinc metalloprotease [Hymenobacter algoricola]|uniref:T9SS type A sorting domain-containing protein n=1 Tax=Hymenobacter algoricola TaxID=486267 RepID=A0ABP7MEI1_9BACT
MKTTFYAVALACLGLGSFAAQAQDARLAPMGGNPAAVVGRNCASMEVLEAQLAADPAMAQRMRAIERQTAEVLAGNGANRTNAIVTIPVVVHVIYNTTAQNVPQAQIDAQIRVLNEDFAKTNADASQIPSLFTGVAASTNVRFVLAKRDPNGAATTGVIRKSTKTRSFSSNDAVKSSSRGGSDAWPADKYLNLWLCNLGNGLLGYAQFPGGAAATDGVVCLYSSVPGGTATSYNKGRTATHEVGHWLNLRHIWGDATCGNDLVSDTPTQQTSNGGCPAFPKVTCGNQGDMSMNYMDYTYDACMYMFTTGQSSRMDALFATGGARTGLITSLGGTAPRAALATTTEVAMYPNPASSVLNLTLPKTANAWNVTVYDLRGHEMKQAVYNGQGQVNVAQLPKGLYQMTISNGEQTTRQRFQKD